MLCSRTQVLPGRQMSVVFDRIAIGCGLIGGSMRQRKRRGAPLFLFDAIQHSSGSELGMARSVRRRPRPFATQTPYFSAPSRHARGGRQHRRDEAGRILTDVGSVKSGGEGPSRLPSRACMSSLAIPSPARLAPTPVLPACSRPLRILTLEPGGDATTRLHPTSSLFSGSVSALRSNAWMFSSISCSPSPATSRT